MPRNRRRLLGVLLSLSIALGAVNPAAAQDAHAVRRTIPLPIEEWLSQGERADFPLKIRVTKPVLTYQQRMLVKVIAEVSTDVLQKRSITRNLHFIVKVADENGKWLAGESYVPFPVQERMSDISELQMVDELYLRPGTFKIAVIAYDSVLQERNVSFSAIQVEKPDEQFPDLLSGMPKVEFLSGEAAGHGSFGEGRVVLPVTTRRSVQLDVLVDLSSYEKDPAKNPVLPPPERNRGISGYNPSVLRPASPEKEQTYLDQLLQTASVVGEINFSNGCTQVTALDTLKRRIVLKTTAANRVEWRSTRADVLSDSHSMISVADIQGGHQAPSFFEEQLEQIMSDSPQCAAEAKPAVHVIAILTRGVHFADGSHKPKIQLKCNCKIFYLRQIDNGEIDKDELKGMLSQLSPQVLEYKNPLQFRKKLSEFVETVQRIAGN